MKGENPIAIAAGFLLAAAMMSPARAGIYTDDLSKCLVNSTSDQQKSILVQWVFAIAALHPSVKPLSSVSDTKRDSLNKGVADLFTVLLTQTCRKETQDAVKYEGSGAIQSSFAVLGQVAMTNLFSDPNVSGGMEGFTKYLDKAKFEGVLTPAPAAATKK